MWTKSARARMARIDRRSKRYPSDPTDEEWAQIAPFFERPGKRRGRKPKHDMRKIMNAIRYLVRSGCSWRMLPDSFPPWETVYRWFRRFVRRLLFRTIHDVALMLDRESQGREARRPRA